MATAAASRGISSLNYGKIDDYRVEKEIEKQPDLVDDTLRKL